MLLTPEQKQHLTQAYQKAKNNQTLIDTSKDNIKHQRSQKQAAYLRNRKVIDEVLDYEMASA